MHKNNAKPRPDVFGWFDSKSSTPAHDPGVEKGLCAACMKPLRRPVVTASLMLIGDSKSYFYRLHKSCQMSMSPEDIKEFDDSLIDSLNAPAEAQQ